jgi:hypothetical protein
LGIPARLFGFSLLDFSALDFSAFDFGPFDFGALDFGFLPTSRLVFRVVFFTAASHGSNSIFDIG